MTYSVTRPGIYEVIHATEYRHRINMILYNNYEDGKYFLIISSWANFALTLSIVLNNKI